MAMPPRWDGMRRTRQRPSDVFYVRSAHTDFSVQSRLYSFTTKTVTVENHREFIAAFRVKYLLFNYIYGNCDIEICRIFLSREKHFVSAHL